MFNQMPYMMSSPMSMMPTSSTLGTASKASLLGKINWSSLLSNAQKTLNVVNQAIPLVRQVGPMMNNMKSMLRVASIFKDETDVKTVRNNTKVSNKTNTKPVNNNNNPNNIKKEVKQKEEYISNDNSPTFFINN